MATLDDLIRLTLEKLVVVGVGEIAAAEDVTTVRAKVTGSLRNLARRGVFLVGDPSDVPDEAMDDLAEICRNAAAASYGQAYSRDAVIAAENRLREMLTPDGAGTETIRALYY